MSAVNAIQSSQTDFLLSGKKTPLTPSTDENILDRLTEAINKTRSDFMAKKADHKNPVEIAPESAVTVSQSDNPTMTIEFFA